MTTMFVLGLAMLFWRNYGASALNATSWGQCRVNPDPHFTTWHGNKYDYHGGCDLVLISNPLLDFHIRTKDFGYYSGIEAAVIKIGGVKVEVQALATTIKVYVDDIEVTGTGTPPATVGVQLYPFTVTLTSPPQVQLTLDGGQFIQITHAWVANNLQVDVLGHGSDFGASEGLCANWAANAPNNLVDRDGAPIYPILPTIYPQRPIQNAYGEEWEVDSTQGDPILFLTNPLGKCNKNYTAGPCVLNPQSTECIAKTDKAKDACSNVTTVRGLQADCEFDVITTGDVGFATTMAYTKPLIENPREKCIESRVVGQANKTCSQLGGRCGWRCNQTLYSCINNLCAGPYDGCSCALPLNITRAPTMVNKTKSPTNAPVRDTSNATHPPTKIPSRAPVKVNVTSAPITNPVPVPNPVNGTKAPTKNPVPVPNPVNGTKSPTKAPVRPTKPPTRPPVRPILPPAKQPTRPPVKPPVRKWCCWIFFCFGGGCGFFQRLLGLC